MSVRTGPRPPLTPGQLSPMRSVPKDIVRPEYVGKPAPTPSTDPWVQPPDVIEAMRVAGRIAAQALIEGGKTVVPGVTTDEVDAVVHELLCDHGATRRPWATAAFRRAAAPP